MLISLICTIVYALICIFLLNLNKEKKQDTRQSKADGVVLETRKKACFCHTDFLIIALITAVYSCVAFYNLGDMTAPETEYEINGGIMLGFEKEQDISKICFYTGNTPIDSKNRMSLTFYDTQGNPICEKEFNNCAVFRWETEDFFADGVMSVEFNSDKPIKLREVAFFDTQGEYIQIKTSPSECLADERNKVPSRSNYLNGTYFDEIYHARTAYELLNKLEVYEWTHPPLGKILISTGIALFGMNPFGWRVTGTVFGIIMLAFIYLFAKRMSGKGWLAAVICIVFAFDFMHFVQTRLATVDVYITFFIILMYYFMYKYYTMSGEKLSETLVPLFWSGLFFGLGTATKWTGIYAGGGLAVIFFIATAKGYKKYLYAKNNTQDILSEEYTQGFVKNTVLTLIFCIFAFVVIPCIIYLLSYIPFIKCNGGGIDAVIKNQRDMFVYHTVTVLNSTHPFSSRWYEWIIMKRPIWYYSGTITDSIKEGISAFGNPLVWWTGIPAVLYTGYMAIRKKDKNAVFLTVSYLAQLLPWIFVDRVVFIYHYFPCTPFLVLCIGYAIYKLYERKHIVKYFAYFYATAVVAMFIWFYPILSGYAVNADYVKNVLEWFLTWHFI